jgi:hypothetical protein
MNNDPTETDEDLEAAKQAFANVVRNVLDGARAARIAISEEQGAATLAPTRHGAGPQSNGHHGCEPP